MDGNRRWAKAHGVPTLEGHRQGLETFRTIVKSSLERDVQYLSAYVFSTENWSRAQEEVTYLMGLLVKAVEKYLDEFDSLGVKICFLGSREGLDKKVLAAMEHSESKTRDNSALTVGLCFNYGGKPELVDAVRKIVASGVSPTDVTPELIDAAVYHPEIPGIDLLLRTSGERRTSGYMLWRSDYAELYFLEKMWPDFTVQDLDEALADYASRQRRFGT